MNKRSRIQAMARVAAPRCALSTLRYGFTMIELLVVMAIIGLLIGLLFPALAAARQQARKTRAKAEVRQLVVAWTAYMNDHPGETPSGSADDIRGKYMEIKPGAFVDPWGQPYTVSFDASSGGETVTRTYQTRAFLYNYNRDLFGDDLPPP